VDLLADALALRTRRQEEQADLAAAMKESDTGQPLADQSDDAEVVGIRKPREKISGVLLASHVARVSGSWRWSAAHSCVMDVRTTSITASASPAAASRTAIADARSRKQETPPQYSPGPIVSPSRTLKTESRRRSWP
jgi:hypothetical protein